MAQQFNDLLRLRGSMSSGRVELEDGHSIFYVRVDPKLECGPYDLVLAVFNRGGSLEGWQVYDPEETEKVMGLRLGSARILEHGRAHTEIATKGPQGAPTTAPDMLLGSPNKENALQTESEAELFNADFGKVAETIFQQGDAGKCPDNYDSAPHLLTTYIRDIETGDLVEAPFQTIVPQCFEGNHAPQTYTWPTHGFIEQPQVCYQTFERIDTRELVIEQIIKSSKVGIGVSISVGLGGGVGAGAPKLADKKKEEKKVSPKPGGPVYAGGGLKVGVSFGYEEIKQWAQLRIEAHQRVVFTLEETKCQDLG